MLTYIEVQKVGDGYEWIEIKGADADHPDPIVIRLVMGDPQEMMTSFAKRYAAKRERKIPIPDKQLQMIEEFFEEACMSKVIAEKGTATTDQLDLLPTTVIHFQYPERTSFRKSRAARIRLFLDEALGALGRRQFDVALARLGWVHLLDPKNELAFELKVVCLRSWKKMAECVRVLEAYVAAHPDKVEPRLGLSEMWLYLEQNQRARESFEALLAMEPNHTMALIGLAQARAKLGEDPSTELRRAWVLDMDYTRDMVEEHFDFREVNPKALVPRTLGDIAKQYHIPLKRMLERARKGVLPMHAPEDEEGLFRFSEVELDRYYHILKTLGLEISSLNLDKSGGSAGKSQAEAIQPSLFDEV
ncbi:hypothetical protein SCOR_19675 [Sulfidibacter corallicola]|uniref:Tetratricopeptide repeat protein n=1 Tax=Sulfidibacter corallicola TaxID=2818388 RepID=A0A8A4TTP1_SULCO|nr:hypothetical protein [Sulfidibacter corallicola]QTD53336.1 hypothetical protein J3U87_12850 [Sulfidibacter corallicola]